MHFSAVRKQNIRSINVTQRLETTHMQLNCILMSHFFFCAGADNSEFLRTAPTLPVILRKQPTSNLRGLSFTTRQQVFMWTVQMLHTAIPKRRSR